MQISIETTTQSSSLFSATFSGNNQGALKPDDDEKSILENAKPKPVNVLEAASQRAEEDAVVIAALQEAIEEGREEDDDDKDNDLATVEDYQKAAGQLRSALGEDELSPSSVAYESATISTTTIEAEIGGETISAEFVSYERVSFSSETGLSVRTASASSIEGDFDNGSFSYESAAVSELYAGTGNQFSNLAGFLA